MSTVMKLSPQDRKELDRFTLFLACKSVQVIVQSRFGAKQKTKSKPHSSVTDWFNLDIPDLPEIQAKVNDAMSGRIPEPGGPSLCTEISLQTAEGESLMLESWQLSVSNTCDTSVRVTYTVYNRMSVLLKSLITITRVTPAYRLSLCQGPDSYIILFNVYMGDPQLHLLGEECKWLQVGQVGTPTGTLTLGVAYRTKMTISPERAAITQAAHPTMIKSDYFKPDLSPRGMRARHRHKDAGDGLTQMQQGAFAPPCPRNEKEIAAREDESPWPLPKPAFSALLSTPAKLTTSTHSRSEDENDSDANDALVEPREVLLPSEDFVLVELKPPFADGEEGGTDLGAFFQECQSAPMLSSFSSQPTLEEQVSEISAHLAALESSLPDLDQFVESVCQSDSLK